MADSLSFLADVQTSVLRSMNPQVVLYVFFEITDPGAFRGWLPTDSSGRLRGPLSPDLPGFLFISEQQRIDASSDERKAPMKTQGGVTATPAEEGGPNTPPLGTFEGTFGNIAFTFRGLRALGVDGGTLATFPQPFCEGMAARAAILGDVGDAAPDHWDGYLGSRETHGVVWFNLKNASAAADGSISKIHEELLTKVAERFPSTMIRPRNGGDKERVQSSRDPQVLVDEGIRILHVEAGMANYTSEGGGSFRIEHFGFRDGVSQPYADLGLAPPAPGGGTPRANGSWAPVALGEILVGHPDEDGRVQHLPANRLLARNGTYMAFRKLEQDVVGFRAFTKRAAKDDPLALAAQMVGRWPDGASLVKNPYGPEQSASGDPGVNDFRYQQDDPLGRRCPIGAHVRRANPRDTNDRDDARRHRIFRRSVSYGGPLLPEGSAGDGEQRGLLFVTMQARLDRQFEFVQASWLNRGELEGQAGARIDPITGAHGGQIEDAFQPSGACAPVVGLPRFVTMRGGDYFFIPSMSALKLLAAGETFAPDPAAPIPQDSIGDIQPATTDDVNEIIEIGKKLLTSADSVYWLPDISTNPYPDAPRPKVVKSAVVGRYHYVKAVLDDDRHFSTRTLGVRALEITGGQKLLIGMRHHDPERKRRLGCLQAALALLPDWPDAFALADGLTKTILRRVLPAGRLDVVGDFGRVVPILCAAQLFGVIGPDYVSATAVAAEFGRLDMTDIPDDWLLTLPAVEDYQKPILSLQTWTRLAFLQIFVNAVSAQEIMEAAERATREFLRQIDALVTQARVAHQANPRSDAPANLLEALVRVPLDRRDVPDPGRHVRLLLAEFAAGSVETVNAALANLFDFLLSNKERVRVALCGALEAAPATPFESLMAKLLNDPAGYRTIIDAVILEALRFQPMGPIAFRYCEARKQIGNTQIHRGVNLVLVPAAAMMDPDIFANPSQFRLDRDQTLYLHFGSGSHACQGEDPRYAIALPMLRALFLNIAALPELRRAAGATGELMSVYPTLADSLVIRFSPS